MLKMCVYYGAMLFPETNVTDLWDYVEQRGFDGYLKYDLDRNGKRNERPGIYSLDTSKQSIFNEFQTYITTHTVRERHDDLLKQAREIKALDDMTKYDLLTAALLAYYGASDRTRINDIIEQEQDSIDLGVMSSYF